MKSVFVLLLFKKFWVQIIFIHKKYANSLTNSSRNSDPIQNQDHLQTNLSRKNQPFTWCCVCVVVSLSLPFVSWPRSTMPTRWFAASATPGFTPGLPTAARRSAVTPQTSDPRRSWSKHWLCPNSWSVNTFALSKIFSLFYHHFVAREKINWKLCSINERSFENKN